MSEISNLTSYTLSSESQNAVKIAGAYAKESLNELIEPAHLLKAVLHKECGLVELLESKDKDYYFLLDWANARLKQLPRSSSRIFEISFSKECYAVFDEAESLQRKYGAAQLEPVFILAALVTPGVGFTFEQLKTFPLMPEELLTDFNASSQTTSAQGKTTAASGAGVKNLSKYCVDKILEAKNGYQPVVIGFDKEIQTVFETLGKKSKSNVLIVGESGIGKTALIDAFVQRIMEEEAPDFLKNSPVYELDLSAISSEANYKGEIEDRAKKVLKEISEIENAVLIIEGIDKIFDKQSMLYGIATLLKKELNRSTLRLIATT